MGEPPFLKRKTQFFFIAQISSKVRSCFFYGSIDLKFGGKVHDSLIFNLNGGDRIWRSGRSSFSSRIEPLQWADDNVLNHVSEEKHARSLWNKLEQLYARKTGNNKLFLIKKMINLKYQDGTPMTDHLNTFQGIINQLAEMNIKFEEEVQGLWLLGTLPNSWEMFRTSLSNSAPNGTMNMDLVKSCVLNEEMKRKSQGSSSQSDVLVAEKRTSWVIDSCASIHATPRKDFFTSYTSGDFGSVMMDNDGSTKAIGMGNVHLETSNVEAHQRFYGGSKRKEVFLIVFDAGKEGIFEKVYSLLSKKAEPELHSKHTAIQGSQFHALVERQSGEKLKCIQTDNGGEYYGPFDEYCRQHGIRHQKTPPKTPQSNGLAERMNRTLVERAFMHVPKDERSKLDAKIRPCVFIGYGQDELGYRFSMIQCKKAYPVPLTHLPTQVENEAHDDQPDIGDIETPTQVDMDDDVHNYEEAMRDENKMKWVDAMQYEMKSLHENHSFELVKLPKGKRALKNRNVSRIDKLRKQLSKSFSMKDLGFNMSKAKVVSSPLASHFKLSSKYNPSIDKEKEDMRIVPYVSAVGSLMYVMVCTRLDIAYVVGVVSRFLSNLGRLHWEAVKWIMRYLRGTSKLKLTFGSGKPVLVSYIDSDMIRDIDNRRFTSGYWMTFSGGVVSWQSKLQKCVALSITEAKYIVAAEACKELLWMKRFIHELGFKQQRYVVYCDNQSVIHLSKNSTFHARSKHIDVRYNWMRDALNDNLFELEKIHTDHNGSDMLTKSLPREKFEACCSMVRMASPFT
ncbi:Retrovirus-related Pol polyprotein from transposon TNT 1-94 [Vitis vinifera]|uniref:Retrovirus-related Pol polyprotein from transposon TNT 1-94 n=1 Tax=Vitis vinifera TaxID=29760 RepID=A0A438KD01_VITVI|nr:Retrovirus-related Pol polyprotein from transposon TNT 1-94 [Vitis vinifera]